MDDGCALFTVNAAKAKLDLKDRHSGQAKREPEEGETGTVERLAWAIHA